MTIAMHRASPTRLTPIMYRDSPQKQIPNEHDAGPTIQF